MSLNPIGSSSPQAVTNRLLQKLPPPGASAAEPDNFSGILGDLMSISSSTPPAAKEASQAPPPAVSQAMNDLLSNQKDVQGDLGLLKGYFAQSPQTLNSLMGALQGKPADDKVAGASGQAKVDNRQAQAIAKYLAEAQKADAREMEGDGMTGLGVVALFG